MYKNDSRTFHTTLGDELLCLLERDT